MILGSEFAKCAAMVAVNKSSLTEIFVTFNNMNRESACFTHTEKQCAAMLQRLRGLLKKKNLPGGDWPKSRKWRKADNGQPCDPVTFQGNKPDNVLCVVKTLPLPVREQKVLSFHLKT